MLYSLCFFIYLLIYSYILSFLQDLYQTDPEPSKLQGSVDCRPYIQKRGYITQPMSEEEKNFPLAFVMTIHKDFSTFEVLLRNIYHPQNIYCIHIDAKSEESFKQQVCDVCDGPSPIQVAVLLQCYPAMVRFAKCKCLYYKEMQILILSWHLMLSNKRMTKLTSKHLI